MLVVGWGTSMLVISPTDEKIPMICNFHHTVVHICVISINRDLNFLFSLGVEETVKLSILSLMFAFLAFLMFSDH